MRRVFAHKVSNRIQKYTVYQLSHHIASKTTTGDMFHHGSYSMVHHQVHD
jgi:hypothetical protein